MPAWVIVLAVALLVGVVVYFATRKKHDKAPEHDYEISRRTYNDGTFKFLAAYRCGTDLHGEPQFLYLGKEGLNGARFTATLYDTSDQAFEAIQRHYGNQRKSEVNVAHVFIENGKLRLASTEPTDTSEVWP